MMNIVVLMLLTVVITNCGGKNFSSSNREASASSTKSLYPEPEKRTILSAHYQQWGGYPGPNGPIFTDLKLTVRADASVLAKLKTAHCEISAVIPYAQFEELVSLVQSSPVRIGQGPIGADFGSSLIGLEDANPAVAAGLPAHLSDDDSSAGQRVLVNGHLVAAQITKIIDSLTPKCPACR